MLRTGVLKLASRRCFDSSLAARGTGEYETTWLEVRAQLVDLAWALPSGYEALFVLLVWLFSFHYPKCIIHGPKGSDPALSKKQAPKTASVMVFGTSFRIEKHPDPLGGGTYDAHHSIQFGTSIRAKETMLGG